MAISTLIVAAALLAGTLLGTAKTGALVAPGWWAAAALAASVGLLYRYLKFFRHYSVEVYVSYAEPPEQKVYPTMFKDLIAQVFCREITRKLRRLGVLGLIGAACFAFYVELPIEISIATKRHKLRWWVSSAPSSAPWPSQSATCLRCTACRWNKYSGITNASL